MRRSSEVWLPSNRHVPRYLTEDAEWLDPEPAFYSLRRREEAAGCDAELGEAWRATPAAIAWLRAAHTASRRSGKRRRR